MFAMLYAVAAAVTTPPAALSPTGPWVVEEEEDLCVLQRSYRADSGIITLALQPLLDLPTIELYVITDDRSSFQKSGKAVATIGDGGHVFDATYFSVPVPAKKLRFTRLTLDRDLFDSLKDGDTLHIAAKPIDATFRILRPEKARPALENCEVSLKKSWGIDPAAPRVTPIGGNPARYFTPSEYPSEAYHKGIYGRVVALLQINTAGNVEHCRILSSAGKELNDATCKVATRVKFKPPRDAQGATVSSTYILPVRWVLPGV